MPKVTEEHMAARRAQIVRAALVCFARAGFHRTTMQDIFRESGLSPGAVYSYFEGKEQITRAIAERALATAHEVFEGATAGGEEPALETLVDRISGGLEKAQLVVGQGRETVAVQLWAEALTDPVLMAELHRVIDYARAQIGALVRAGQERGEIDAGLDPDALARTTLALLHGLMLQRAWYPDMDADAYRAAARALLAAIQTPAAAG